VFSSSATNVYLSDSTSGGYSTISVTTGALSSLGIGLGANASNVLSAIANPAATKTVTIGTQAYTFVATLTGAANEVLVGGTTRIRRPRRLRALPPLPLRRRLPEPAAMPLLRAPRTRTWASVVAQP
jgi:hypothetical protein